VIRRKQTVTTDRISITTFTLYRESQKKVSSYCLSIPVNRIKTCRQSYFFVKAEYRTSHWGKCEQAPVGIKYFVD